METPSTLQSQMRPGLHRHVVVVAWGLGLHMLGLGIIEGAYQFLNSGRLSAEMFRTTCWLGAVESPVGLNVFSGAPRVRSRGRSRV